MRHRGRGRTIASVVGAAALAAAVSAPAPAAEPNAASVFAGRLTDNKWREIAALDDIGLRDAYLLGAALSREVGGGVRWAVEVEGQVVKHFGSEQHWELNGVLLGRWRAFPWDATLPTSVAFGIGPSYATEVPPEEVAMNGASARLLLYWTVELELSRPDRPFSAFARLHHRSNGYGVFAETGGSNWLALGLRRRF